MLDYFKFQQRAENQDSILEIINGVSEMKLNQFEEFKRKAWVKIQNKLFKTNLRIFCVLEKLLVLGASVYCQIL